MTTPPQINNVPPRLTFVEDATGTGLDLRGVTFVDPDLAGGILRVEISATSGSFALAADADVVLGGNGTSTITVQGTLLAVHHYLSQPTNMLYLPQANLSGADVARITITASDPGNIGTESSVSASPIVIDITAVNDAPVVTTSGGTTAFTEPDGPNNAPMVIDSGLTLTDVDNATLASATLSITGNFQSDEDRLGFVNDGVTMGNISAIYNAGTGVMTLASVGATATLDQWQAALRTVTYNNSNDAPSTAARTISLIVNDGNDNSSPATKTIALTAVNDTPTVTGLPTDISITEDVPGPLDIASSSFGDLDTASISVTLSVSVGIIAIAAPGGIAVALGGNATSSVTVSGAPTSVNAYLDIPSNVIYLPPANLNGVDAATLTVSADDGSGSVILGTVPINITAVNDAPTDISLSTSQVAENDSGAIIGDLTTTDPDIGDTHTYMVDDARFEIVGDQLKLKDGISLDYEAEPSVTLAIRSTDSDGAFFNKSFTITVTDIYEAPPNAAPRFTGPSELSVRENQSLIAPIAATDPDGDMLRYSIIGGDDAPLFTIDASTGTLAFGQAPDFEAPHSADGTNVYEVRVGVSDGTDSASKLFSVTVTDTAEVARFYNITTGTHFYTADSTERDLLIATNTDSVFEGETFSTAATDADGVSVHRFYNTLTGGHFYTADADEAASVRTELPQFSDEGEAFIAYAAPQSDRQAVHRFYNVETKAHFYTSDEAERDNVLATLPQYNYEGVGFYVDFV